MTEFTRDTFFNGCLHVRQSANGYRYSIDAVLLASLTAVRPGDRIADLGTGCGIIPLILMHRHPDIARIYGIEIQEELAEIARCNVTRNVMDDRIRILCRDLKTLAPADTSGPVDLIVSNPPHYKPRSGRINADSQRAIARHEIAMTIDDLMDAARRMLTPGGRLSLIYPAERLVDLSVRMREAGIEPKKLRLIHPGPGTGARLIVMEGIRGKRPAVKIAHPLYIHDESGNYTPEVAAMLRG